MVLKPTYYLSSFMSGQFTGWALPLENVALSSSLEPGRFSADLDMRKAVSSFADAERLLDQLREGKSSITAVDGSDVLGEWWISEIAATYSDPVVRLSGPEWIGYSKDILVTETWQGDYDAFLVLRDMLREMTRTSQTLQLSLGTALAGFTVPTDVRLSQTDYWSAIRSLQDGEPRSFEWRIVPSLSMAGSVPTAVGRTLVMGSPALRVERPDIVLELKTPGTTPATALDMTRSWSEHAVATTVYGFGAGSGEDQIRAYTSRQRPPGEPGKSKMITVRDALTYEQVRRATAAALKTATPADKVFPVVMPTDYHRPAIGEVYGFLREPSWSMPAAYDGKVRCVGWSWSSPQPGRQDVFTLDLVDA